MLSAIIIVISIFVALCSCASRFPEAAEYNFDALKTAITQGDGLHVFKKKFEAAPLEEQKAFQRNILESAKDNVDNPSKNILNSFVDYWYRYRSGIPLQHDYAQETISILYHSHIAKHCSQRDKNLILIYFVKYTKTSFFRLYIDAKSNLNVQDYEHKTALHWAVSSENGEYVDLLINGGADILLRDSNRRSPLHYAIADKKSLMVFKLCQRLPVSRIGYALGRAYDYNSGPPIIRQVVHGIHISVMRHISEALLQDDSRSVYISKTIDVEELVRKHTFSSSKNDWQREAPFDKDYDVRLDEDSENVWKRLNIWENLLRRLYTGCTFPLVIVAWENKWNINIRTLGDLYHLVTRSLRLPVPTPMLQASSTKSTEAETMTRILTNGAKEEQIGEIRYVKPVGWEASDEIAFKLKSAEKTVISWTEDDLKAHGFKLLTTRSPSPEPIVSRVLLTPRNHNFYSDTDASAIMPSSITRAAEMASSVTQTAEISSSVPFAAAVSPSVTDDAVMPVHEQHSAMQSSDPAADPSNRRGSVHNSGSGRLTEEPISSDTADPSQDTDSAQASGSSEHPHDRAASAPYSTTSQGVGNPRRSRVKELFSLSRKGGSKSGKGGTS